MIRIKGLDHVVIRAQYPEAMVGFYCDPPWMCGRAEVLA